MFIKNIFFMLFCSILGLTTGHMRAAASSSDKPNTPKILCTLEALKNAKIYPFPLHEAGYLEALSKSLSLQDEIMQVYTDYTSCYDRLRANHASMNQILPKILENGGIKTPDGTISGTLRATTSEQIGFVLRYKNIIGANVKEFDEQAIQEAKTMISLWQNPQDPLIQNIINIIKIKIPMSKDDRQVKAIGPELTRKHLDWANLYYENKTSHKLKALFDKQNECPLLFINKISRAHLSYQRVRSNPNDDAATTELIFDNICKRIIEQYQNAQNELNTLKQAIALRIKERSPKPTALPQAYIPQLPKHNPQQPKSKKKKRIELQKQIAAQKARQTGIISPQILASETPDMPNNTVAVSTPIEQESTIPIASSSTSNNEEHLSSSPDKKCSLLKTGIQETDTCITINDEKNKCTITLFKVSNPQTKYTDPNYTEWVKAWFEDPQQARIGQGYKDPKNSKFKYRKDAHIVHGFSLEVDRYISTCGTQSKIANRTNPKQQDISISIPGSIKYPDGTDHLGLFTYIIDSANGQWYHRNFIPRTAHKLVNNYMEKGYYEVEFPELR